MVYQKEELGMNIVLLLPSPPRTMGMLQEEPGGKNGELLQLVKKKSYILLLVYHANKPFGDTVIQVFIAHRCGHIRRKRKRASEREGHKNHL